jgi:hypothetical protein
MTTIPSLPSHQKKNNTISPKPPSQRIFSLTPWQLLCPWSQRVNDGIAEDMLVKCS